MVRIACSIVAISLALAATVRPSAAGTGCASGVTCPNGDCCISSAAVCNAEFDDCCESGKLCGGGTVCCANAGDTCCDVGGSSRCCAAGTSCTADGQCVQNTPTATLSATPTHTPIPNGGSCVDPLDCASG